MDSLCEGQAEAVQSRDPAPATVAERNEMHQLVLDVLATLPARQQEVFRLKFQEGMTYRDIRRVTGYPISTVSNLVRGAIDTIRQRLREQSGLLSEV